MTDDRKPCRNVGCIQTVPATREFCYSCEALLRRDGTSVLSDLEKLLHDEAAFCAWCDEHGQPNPHD